MQNEAKVRSSCNNLFWHSFLAFYIHPLITKWLTGTNYARQNFFNSLFLTTYALFKFYKNYEPNVA